MKNKDCIEIEVDEVDVETCLELARMYDTEDLTHPPFRVGGEKTNEEGE